MPDDKILLAERHGDGYSAAVAIRSGTSGKTYEITVSLSSGNVLDHPDCRGFEMRGDCRHARMASAHVSEKGWIVPIELDPEAF